MADIEIVLNKISLDIKKNGIQAIVHAKKGDIQSRAIIITFRIDGNNYRVADGVTAVIRAKKPDGTVIYNSATVQDGKVYFLFTSQYCAVAGKYTGEVQLVKSGKVLYTPKFAINVEDNIYDDSEIESTNEYTQLTEAIEDAQDALETAQNLQLIKYVTDLDDPGDEKYLYVLEEKEPYFTMTDFPTTVTCATIFESTSSVYPFLAFTGMILQEETYANPGVIEFRDFVDASATGNYTSMFGYSAAEEKWVHLYDFDYSGASALTQGDEIILTDEVTGTHTPIISDYVIKTNPLYEIGNSTRVVYIYDNSQTVDSIFYLVDRYTELTYTSDDNVFDISDIPEILTDPTGIPYVYDKVTNQYVALLDATAESLLNRVSALENVVEDIGLDIQNLDEHMTAAEGDINTLRSNITSINNELDFEIVIHHNSNNSPTINHTFTELATAYSNGYNNPKVYLSYVNSNNVSCQTEGFYAFAGSVCYLWFNTSDKTYTETRKYTLSASNVLSVTIEKQINQAKLTEGANITIDNTDPNNPVISATGGGSGSTYTAGNGITIDSNNEISTFAVKIFNMNPNNAPTINHTYQEISNEIDGALGEIPVYLWYEDDTHAYTSAIGSCTHPSGYIIFKFFTGDATHYEYREYLLTSGDVLTLESRTTETIQTGLTEGDGISIVNGVISVDYDDGDSEVY